MGERIIRRSVDGDVGKGGERRRIDWPPPPPPPSFPHPPPCSTFGSNAFFVCLYRAEHGGGKSKDFVPVENIVEIFLRRHKKLTRFLFVGLLVLHFGKFLDLRHLHLVLSNLYP